MLYQTLSNTNGLIVAVSFVATFKF